MRVDCLKCSMCILYTLGILLIVIGAVIPVIVNKVLEGQISDKGKLSSDNYGLWGQVPGDSGMVLVRSFRFYNFTNEDDVIFFNATPELIETQPYDYQEFQNYTNPNYYSDGGFDFVNYTYWEHMQKMSQGNQSDQVKVVNPGALGFWYQVKNAEKSLLSLQAMGMLAFGFESQLMVMALSQGILLAFLRTKSTAVGMFMSAGLSEEMANVLWDDPNYGWGNLGTIQTWVDAYPRGPYSDQAKTLRNYFNLGYDVYVGITEGVLKKGIDGVKGIIYQLYCSGVSISECDASYLSALQWASQGITLNPPAGPKYPSITSLNSTASGYPELGYYHKGYFLKNINGSEPYQNVSFPTSWAHKLLNHSKDASVWYKETHLLLHKANMEFLWKYGLLFEKTKDFSNLEPIRQRFLLNSTEQTHVFWSYIQYMVDGFALRLSENGTAGIIGMAGLGSGSLYEQFTNLTNYLGSELRAQLIFQNLSDTNTSCLNLMEDSLSASESKLKAPKICSYIKSNSSWVIAGLKLLLDICRNNQDQNSIDFMNNTGVTLREVLELCDTYITGRNTFGTIMHNARVEIKSLYNCTESLVYCTDLELAQIQWGSSNITRNPPPKLIPRLKRSRSVSSWNPEAFPHEIEYAALTERISKILSPEDQEPLNKSFVTKLLTFDCLFSAGVLQNALIWKKNGKFENITNVLYFQNSTAIFEYFRYLTIYVALNGLTQTRSVNDILIGYQDPVLTRVRNMNTALGGNPSVNPVVALCPNFTYPIPPGSEDHRAMYTGGGDVNKIRYFKQILGNENIKFNNTDFNGNESYWELIDAWKETVPIVGTDAFLNQPLEDENTIIKVYVTQLMRWSLGIPSSQISEYNGINARRYHMDPNLLKSKQNCPDNDKFYQDRWDGFLNFTNFMKIPLFNSKLHFYDTDPLIPKMVKLYSDAEKKNLIVPNAETDDLYLDIEPFSGLAVSAYMRLQANLEFDTDELFNSSPYAMVPIFSIIRGGTMPDSKIDDFFGPLKMALSFSYIGRIVFLCFGCLFVVLAILLTIKWHKRRQAIRNLALLNTEYNPIIERSN